MYRAAFERANLLRMSLVLAALTAGVIVLGATMTPAHATFPGENGLIAYSEVEDFPSGDFEIYTMRPDGTDVTQVTYKKGRDQLPTWSPDGTKLGWVHGQGGEFWVHDLEAGHQRMVIDFQGGVDSAVVWSPDGSNLAYSQATPNGKEADIYVMRADGTNPENLTNTPSVGEWEFTWSPDGSKLAYIRDSAIYVMNADGTNPVNITNSMPEGTSSANPNWSPDGTKIAVISCPQEQDPGSCGIYVVNADGTNPANITSAATPELYGPPVWSPDGTKIAYHTCIGESSQDCDIYVTNANSTKEPVNITNRPEIYYGFGTDAGHTLNWQPLPGKKTVRPPDTGGPSLLFVASALLFSGGVLLYAVVRRRI